MDYPTVQREIARRILLCGMLGCGGFLLAGSVKGAAGMALGSAASFLVFTMLCRSVGKSLAMAPAKAALYARQSYLLRYSLAALTLAVAAGHSLETFIPAAVGLMLPKWAVYSLYLLRTPKNKPGGQVDPWPALFRESREFVRKKG